MLKDAGERNNGDGHANGVRVATAVCRHSHVCHWNFQWLTIVTSRLTVSDTISPISSFFFLIRYYFEPFSHTADGNNNP
jgi:hypothetical protein